MRIFSFDYFLYISGWRNEYSRSGAADGAQERQDHLQQRGRQRGARPSRPASGRLSGHTTMQRTHHRSVTDTQLCDGHTIGQSTFCQSKDTPHVS